MIAGKNKVRFAYIAIITTTMLASSFCIRIADQLHSCCPRRRRKRRLRRCLTTSASIATVLCFGTRVAVLASSGSSTASLVLGPPALGLSRRRDDQSSPPSSKVSQRSSSNDIQCYRRTHRLLAATSQERSQSSSPKQPSILYVANRRCLYAPARSKKSSSNSEMPPPLVVIGGTAQSIHSWEHHVPKLSANRDVLVYECLGQGPPPPPLPHPDASRLNTTTTTQQDDCYSNVSLAFQAEDFAAVVNEAFGSDEDAASRTEDGAAAAVSVVDVAGFSFGGRVALAAASVHPHLIRKLHVTGIGATRGDYAKVVLASWKDMLSPTNDDGDQEEATRSARQHASQQKLRSFAWSTILSTYSERFVASMGADRVRTWIDGMCQQNTVEGLRALLQQTHEEGEEEETNPWSPLAMAQRISTYQATLPLEDRISVRLCIGLFDKMSTVKEAKVLAEFLSSGGSGCTDAAVQVFDNCGHAVPVERGREWSTDLLNFLSEEE